MTSPGFKNRDRRTAVRWLGVGLLSLGTIIGISFSGMDMMNAGYGLMTLAGCVLVTALIAAAIYRARGRRLQRLVAGEGLLVHWTYSPEEWRRYIEEDFAQEKREKAALFKLVAAIACVVGLVMVIALGGEALLIFGILFAILALLGFFAQGVPRLTHRVHARSGAETFLSRTGAYVGGAFHDWSMLGAVMDDVALNDAPVPLLVIRYSCPTGTGPQQYTIRIPIPAGCMDEAKHVRATLERPPQAGEESQTSSDRVIVDGPRTRNEH